MPKLFKIISKRRRNAYNKRWARATAPLSVERLEDRCLPSVTGFRPIDEVENNIANPNWGTAGTDLIRISPVAYADGISAPSQPNTLSTREISNNLNNQSDPIFSARTTSALRNPRTCPTSPMSGVSSSTTTWI